MPSRRRPRLWGRQPGVAYRKSSITTMSLVWSLWTPFETIVFAPTAACNLLARIGRRPRKYNPGFSDQYEPAKQQDVEINEFPSFATSTSTNTNPNVLVVAGVLVPGTKKLTSTMLLFCAVKAADERLEVAGNRITMEPPALALTRNWSLSIKTAPRGSWN